MARFIDTFQFEFAPAEGPSPACIITARPMELEEWDLFRRTELIAEGEKDVRFSRLAPMVDPCIEHVSGVEVEPSEEGKEPRALSWPEDRGEILLLLKRRPKQYIEFVNRVSKLTMEGASGKSSPPLASA